MSIVTIPVDPLGTGKPWSADAEVKGDRVEWLAMRADNGRDRDPARYDMSEYVDAAREAAKQIIPSVAQPGRAGGTGSAPYNGDDSPAATSRVQIAPKGAKPTTEKEETMASKRTNTETATEKPPRKPRTPRVKDETDELLASVAKLKRQCDKLRKEADEALANADALAVEYRAAVAKLLSGVKVEASE